MDLLHIRLKEELERLGLKAAAAARAAGEPDSQGLRDVLGGRKRLSADLLAALGATSGVDMTYVLTGVKYSARVESLSESLSPEERLLVERYREAPKPIKDAALRVLLLGDAPTGRGPRYTVEQNFHGDVGQQGAGDIINKGKGEKK